jgi:hypothetical protein
MFRSAIENEIADAPDFVSADTNSVWNPFSQVSSDIPAVKMETLADK